METQRLFDVIRDERLFEEHSEVICSVRFAGPLNEHDQFQFREIIDSWTFLGHFAAMPDYHAFEYPVTFQMVNREKRTRTFLSASLKYYVWGGIEQDVARFEVDFGLLDTHWLDTLLNCLEAYHVRVAPIASVELKTGW